MACMLALSLDRPCVLDLSPRDKYYTFRSFLNRGTYDWSHDLPNTMHPHIEQAIKLLPTEASSSWENASLTFSDILPMMPLDVNVSNFDSNIGFQKAYANEAQERWSSHNPENSSKILLFPNWGAGWKGDLALFADNQVNCNRNILTTKIQNSLFAPTDTAKTLFAARKQEVLPSPIFVYGAIQLRTWFLKNDKLNTVSQYVEKVHACIRLHSDISNWWILSDDPQLAINITNVEIPGYGFYHGYTDLFLQKNRHSGGAGMGRFHHEEMTGSILDWMVLHEAQVAVVTTSSKYAETGARGNEKVEKGACIPGLHSFSKQ
eukprot:CAMPEP_0172440680 /NCGR_PEP_ID=MMETSP1065-20121228/1312_1 /TAXON_ID=265537 /ORGANISM="Amphiprora paludosa, Strain CCMP125" /LENGTH=318 /DNA_ID=CAMNT_0013189651 /DNA_START=225 /DNA_END=1181 /DNA_ORIENTATION=-